ALRETAKSWPCDSPSGRHSRRREVTPRRRSKRTTREPGCSLTKPARRSSGSRRCGAYGWSHRTERARAPRSSLDESSWRSPSVSTTRTFDSLRLARELDHPTSIIVALVWACVFRDLRREVHEAGEHARALIALSTEHEASQWLAAGTIVDVSVRAELGEGQLSIAQISR